MDNNLIKKQMRSGAIVSMIARYSEYFFQLIITAILSRLLTPKDFGIIAVVNVIIIFFRLFSDVGIGPAIIQDKGTTSKEISAAFNLTFFLGVFLGILFFFSSYIIAAYYNNDAYLIVSKWLSLSLFFSSLSIVPRAILRKAKKFGKLGALIIISNIIAGTTAIISALNGMNYMALVYKSILDNLFQFILIFIASRISIRFVWSANFFRRIYRYASYQFLFDFVNYFSRNLDKLLIGKYISETQLGYYEKSYRLMMLPLQTLTHVVAPVFHPVLSEIQNQKELMYKTYLKMAKILAIVGFPLSSFLFFNTEEAVFLVFGSQWGDSIPVFKILSLSVGFQMVLSSTGSVFQAAGRTDLLFLSGLFSSIFMIAGTVIGVLFNSIEIVALGLLAAFVINFLQGHYLLIIKGFHQKLWPFVRILINPLIMSIVIFVILYLFETFFSSDKLFLQLLIKTMLSAIVFLLMALLNGELKEIIKYIR